MTCYNTPQSSNYKLPLGVRPITIGNLGLGASPLTMNSTASQQSPTIKPSSVIQQRRYLNTPQWKDISLPGKTELSGAILPFAEQNFFQVLFFPYTYALMYYMDFLLNYMPWWMVIVGTTVTARLLFFPLVVKQNVTGIRANNVMPETQRLQVKMNEARVDGDAYSEAISRTKLQLLYQEHNITTMQRLGPILIQVPLYMSMFFLLRKLSMHPLESMVSGGAFWFTNLTVPDPFYILPILTCTSTLITLEYGLEGSSSGVSAMGPTGRWFLRSMPLLLFAFVYNFPAAVLLFWTTNNFFTLFYALLLKNSWVKQKLNIPKAIKHDPVSLPLTNQSFMSQYQNAKKRAQANKTTLEVRRLDDIQFRKAGVGPLKKTYKHEPPKETTK